MKIQVELNYELSTRVKNILDSLNIEYRRYAINIFIINEGEDSDIMKLILKHQDIETEE